MAVDKTPAAQAADEEKELPEAEVEEKEAPEVGEESAEEADAPDAEDDAEEAEDGKPLSKSQIKRQKIKARIATLEDIARRESDRADREAAARKSLTDDLGPEPKEADFPNGNDYIAAKAAWLSESRLVAREKKVRESNATQATQDAGHARMNLFHERAMSLVDRIPDIEAKVFSDPTAPINEVMRDVLMERERGPEVAYYLVTHREEASRITRMPPLAIALEIGRIEATLDAPQSKSKPKAPPPPPTLKGNSAMATRDPDKMSADEWLKWRNAQLTAKKG